MMLGAQETHGLTIPVLRKLAQTFLIANYHDAALTQLRGKINLSAGIDGF